MDKPPSYLAGNVIIYHSAAIESERRLALREIKQRNPPYIPP